MKKLTTYFLSSLFFWTVFLPVEAFSQHSYIWEDSVYLSDIKELNKEFIRFVKQKDRKLAKRKGLEIIHFPILRYTKDSVSKEEVLDQSFFYNLELEYCQLSKKKKNTYLPFHLY